MGISDLWYKSALVYGVDVEMFLDSDGDGDGDFRGLTSRLPYLRRLGFDCLWLLPFHPSPDRDNGYDITDYYGVDPRHGSLGDFAEFLHEAQHLGMRVLIDLVVNHTSDEHPWFQEARRSRESPYHDFYVWTDEPPPRDRQPEPIFPGECDSVWTYAEEVDRWYFHRFYDFEPGLNHRNPRVRDEIYRIMGFWLQLGVSGFRVDSAPLLIWPKGPRNPEREADHTFLMKMRHFVTRRRAGGTLLAEANVRHEHIAEYFGEYGNEFHMLFNFGAASQIFLAFARGEAQPLVELLQTLPEIPEEGQWLNFLRHFDELSLEHMPADERREVFEAFAPAPHMQIFGRGIRRRMASMLGGDQRRIRLAFSLLYALPGTPLVMYGDEIGMGDDLTIPGRESIRTPMQWSDERNGGFSEADPSRLPNPVISGGHFGYERVNVARQRMRGDSLLNWIERLAETRKECPEIGLGACRLLDVDDHRVLALRNEWEGGACVTVHNLSDEPLFVTLPDTEGGNFYTELLADADYEHVDAGERRVEVGPYGYRWFRIGGVQRDRVPD